MAAGKVRFDYVHERNIGSVKKLLQMTLPVEYPEAFYDALVKSPQDLTQLGKGGAILRILKAPHNCFMQFSTMRY